MPVTDYYLIGKVTVPSAWIAFLAGFFITYVLIRLHFGKKHAQEVGDALFYLVIIWKFSVVLTDFSSVLQAPLSILYFHGGKWGFFLGLLFVTWNILRKHVSSKHAIWTILLTAVSWQSIYEVTMVLLNQGGVWVKIGTVVIFAAMMAVAWWMFVKQHNSPFDMAVLWAAGNVFAAAFQPGPFWGTSLIVSLWIAAFLIIMKEKKERKVDFE